MKIIFRTYNLYLQTLNLFTPVFLLALRGYFGYRFFMTGLGKLENLSDVTDFFLSLGIPLPSLNAVMAGATEMVGGAMLLLGLGSRVVALPLTFTMVVAYMTAHRESVVGFLENPSEFFRQEPFPFLIAALVVLFLGAGRWSIDEFLYRKYCEKKNFCPASGTSRAPIQ